MTKPIPFERLTDVPMFLRGNGAGGEFARSLKQSLGNSNLALVTGKGCIERNGAPGRLLKQMLADFPHSVHLTIEHEPSDLWVDQAKSRICESRGVKAVVSIGGGSCLDAGKALAVMLEESCETKEVLEGVGSRKPRGKMKPWYAIPTTAGTGSESSTNAVLSRPGPNGFKKSLRHPSFKACGIVLDPEMIRDVPPLLAATAGMDAFTQLLESWSSTRVPAPLEPWLETGLLLAYDAIPKLVELGPQASDTTRQAMLDAACLSGIGLTQAGLGTTHGLAGLLGAYTPAPHGWICAKLMGPALRETLLWLEQNKSEPANASALSKFNLLNQKLSTLGVDAFAAIQQWSVRFSIPPQENWQLDASTVKKVIASGSDRDSPAKLGPDVWSKILLESL